MWVITLKSDGIMCIDFTFQDTDYHVLPVFTSPDAAVMFAGDLEHNGEPIKLIHIGTMDRVDDLHELLNRGTIELIVLDPPNLESDGDFDMIHWTASEFSEMLDSIVKIGEKFNEDKAINALNTYIHSIRNGEDVAGPQCE